jgi:hypothetical protein
MDTEKVGRKGFNTFFMFLDDVSSLIFFAIIIALYFFPWATAVTGTVLALIIFFFRKNEKKEQADIRLMQKTLEEQKMDFPGTG